jgi:hypothetical protein
MIKLSGFVAGYSGYLAVITIDIKKNSLSKNNIFNNFNKLLAYNIPFIAFPVLNIFMRDLCFYV